MLGAVIVAGTIIAALAVRPRAGWMIFPVPALTYVVAAVAAGVVHDRSEGLSRAALAANAAEWIAAGFFAMALATVLAVVVIAVRWLLWRRRGRQLARDAGWAGPDRGTPRSGGADPRRSPAPAAAETGHHGPRRALQRDQRYNFSSGAKRSTRCLIPYCAPKSILASAWSP
jgi:hypothetical protein